MLFTRILLGGFVIGLVISAAMQVVRGDDITLSAAAIAAILIYNIVMPLQTRALTRWVPILERLDAEPGSESRPLGARFVAPWADVCGRAMTGIGIVAGVLAVALTLRDDAAVAPYLDFFVLGLLGVVFLIVGTMARTAGMYAQWLISHDTQQRHHHRRRP